MWSNPAPPYCSGSAMPVRPSSAALRKVSRGKRPVSSSSRASGFTSELANSRTVCCSSFCSSVKSRCKRPPRARSQLPRKSPGSEELRYNPVVSAATQGNRPLERQGVRNSTARSPRCQPSAAGSQCAAELVVGDGQVLGLDAGFANGGHEVGVAGPARQDVQVYVADDASAGAAAQVHPKVVALGLIVGRERDLHALGKLHHLGERCGVAPGELSHMREGHDHNVAGGVGEAVEDDEVLAAAMKD